MIETYLEAAIRQARERARILKTKMPRPARHPDLIALQRACDQRLDQVIAELEFLLEDDDVRAPDNVRERVRLWRRCLVDLSRVETTGIVALSRSHPDDVFLNRLVFQIHQEINYPLPPPTACCLSRDYFSIDTALHLLEVPPAESDFLLHLPDLYHELGHPLVAVRNDPQVEPFQTELGRFLATVYDYLQAERAANLRSTGPKEYHGQILDLLERAWMPWSNELFCDLFAINTLGPAYAWSHFHLTAIYCSDPYGTHINRYLSHPPDQARMEAMLIALDLLGFQREGADIQSRWETLVRTIGVASPPTYRKACPRRVLECAAIHALDGTRKIGCRIAGPETSSPVHHLLNAAWNQFWATPHDYPHWEQQQTRALRARFA